MDFLAARRELHRRHWPAVERFVHGLPPRLHDQARLLRNEVQGFYSTSTRCEEVLLEPDDYPVTDLPVWLLTDLSVDAEIGNERRQAGEEHLSRASLFIFLGTFLREKILDRSSAYDSDFLLLADALERRTVRELSRVCPPDSPFWDRYRGHWETYGEALLWDRAAQPAPAEAEDLLVRAELLEPLKIVPAAAAFAAGRSELCSALEEALDPLHQIFQVRRELSSIRHDLEIGRHTFPIAMTLRRAGIPHGPLVPAQVLGALLLTGAAGEITDFCRRNLKRCHDAAGELDLPTLQAWLNGLDEAIKETRDVFKPGTGNAADRRRPFFLAPEPAVPTATTMAETYLLSVLESRDNWEVHANLLGGERPATWFPTGFLLETLAAHGHRVTARVDECFRRHREVNGYAYFDGAFPWPDTDSLATLLRLHPFSGRGDLHREVLDTMLGWTRRNVRPSGRIPVWIGSDAEGDVAEERLISEGCGTVEANFLRGLFADGRQEKERSLIEGSATRLCERFADHGSPHRVSVSDPLARHKTTSYLSRLLALRRAREASCFEAIWFSTNHELAEGSISNVLLVRGGEILTPPLDAPILPGIMRGLVLEEARRSNITVTEKPLTIDDLLDADEMLLTNSMIQVLPVARVERSDIGGGSAGPMAKSLLEVVRDRVRRECAK